MSRQKLTIIVTCTDRKLATPRPELMARNLPRGEVETRARVWTKSVARSQTTSPLIDLYRGETWSQVKRLIATARDVGFEPDVLVASAGLGLRSLSDTAPAYAATFSAGHPDSVAVSTAETRAWWRTLPRTSAPVGGRALWVLSESYSRAIGTDLLDSTAPNELLVFGGSREIPDDFRIASDRWLRQALGGTTTSLNLRAATQWLTLTRNTDPFAEDAQVLWRDWSERSRRQEEYNRKAMSDSAVLEFISALRTHDPAISKTRALKSLRDSGLACEQRRFSDLFQQAVAR